MDTSTPQGRERRFDVLGLGCAAIDDFLYVPSFPGPDSKMRVARSARRFGGLTGAALVTAARMGARAAYAGCVGQDENSRLMLENFAREGVNTEHAPRAADATAVRSTIVVAMEGGTRNVFYEANGVIGAHDSLPDESVIRSSAVLFIDNYGMQGNLRAVRIARASGIPVVADFEENTSPLFDEVMSLVDHLILSEEFARRITGTNDAATAAAALWTEQRAAVVVTCGASGCWSVSNGDPRARHHPAFPVSARDTTGCGDVFHGAYAASLAQGGLLEDHLRFASAAAAWKAMHSVIPNRREVEDLLRSSCQPAHE